MMQTIIFIGIVAICVVFNLVKIIANQHINNKNNITNHKWQTGDSLQHKDCEVKTGDACLHNERNSTDGTICKKCGFKNVKSARKCSVCGNKLWKL